MPTTYTPCPVYRKCGGCQLQNLEYPRQLVWKQDRCQKLLGRFGKVSPILGMESTGTMRWVLDWYTPLMILPRRLS